jgi:hypothetical protein
VGESHLLLAERTAFQAIPANVGSAVPSPHRASADAVYGTPLAFTGLSSYDP